MKRFLTIILTVLLLCISVFPVRIISAEDETQQENTVETVEETDEDIEQEITETDTVEKTETDSEEASTGEIDNEEDVSDIVSEDHISAIVPVFR